MASTSSLSILTAFLLSVCHGQVNEDGFFNISWPSFSNDIHWIRMSFSDDGLYFIVSMKITGDHWAALGFADSADDIMEGTDAWVYGDFGGDELEVLEFALGDHAILGTLDAQQNLDVKSIYQSGDTTQIRVDRLLDTGNRDDYVITQGGTLCIMYAFGVSLPVETGHNSSTRGIECFDIDGETEPPTPAPTYVPTPAPSDSPTIRPTKDPTVAGETARPTPSPTYQPTKLPTTSAPTLTPTNPITGIPSRAPTPGPTRPPTRDLSAPTPSPSLQPTKAPTPTFDDDIDPNANTDAPVSDKEASDAFEVWTYLIVGLLALLVVCLLGTICFCYERNRRIRKKRNEEKEKAYEELENYRAQHGLDIPNAGPQPVRDEDDNVGYVGKSARLPDHDSDDEVDSPNGDDYNPPNVSGGAGIGAGLAANARKKDRGPKHKNERKKPAYRKKDLKIDDDDDDVDLARPSEAITNVVEVDEDDHESKQSKFVDPKQARKEKAKKEKESLKKKEGKKEKTDKTGNDNNNNDEEDDYDYEAARKEREERRKRRAAARKRASAKKAKAGKFGVFNDDQW